MLVPLHIDHCLALVTYQKSNLEPKAQWNVSWGFVLLWKRWPTTWFCKFLTFSHMISVFFQPNWLYLGLKTQLVWKKTKFMWENVKNFQNHVIDRCFHNETKPWKTFHCGLGLANKTSISPVTLAWAEFTLWNMCSVRAKEMDEIAGLTMLLLFFIYNPAESKYKSAISVASQDQDKAINCQITPQNRHNLKKISP